jgi:rSAM/selenodomain-associated transferase 2
MPTHLKPTCTLSIIMPVYNEAAGLASTLSALNAFVARGAELIVVDGGSTDTTLAVANKFTARVVSSAPGRAAQMNAGAAIATGDVFLFLHADTFLPTDSDALIAAALDDGRFQWGRFDVRISGQSKLLPMVSALMNWRSRYSFIATGDQAMFMTRSAFAAVGGFPDQPLMEDIEISKRLLSVSRPACLRAQVLTSGRRWDSRGAWPTIWLMWRLRLAYWRGVPVKRLAQLYR